MFLRGQPSDVALVIGGASGLVWNAPFRLYAGAGRSPDGALPSWNDGTAKQAIVKFVLATTDRASPEYVPQEERIAVFDQDGTLWVEHPMYTEWSTASNASRRSWRRSRNSKHVEPFKTVLSGNREAMARLTMHDLEKVLAVTLTGMTVEAFGAEVKKWLETARHPRWNCLYTELVYQPMLEALRHLRENGYKTYIATGGGQDFVRVYSGERVWHSAGTGSRHDRWNEIWLWQRRQAVLDQGAQAPAQR